MPLEIELAYFEQQKSRLLRRHPGQFALIKERNLLGTYPTFELAYVAGVETLGNQPFLIRQILKKQPVISIYSANPAFATA